MRNKSNLEMQLELEQQDEQPKKISFKRPGRLLNDIKLRIHTQDAQILFGGYQSKESVGLLMFGKQMANIWKAAAKDDPYADLYLLKVYDAILKLRKYFSIQIEKYQTQLAEHSRHPNLEITPFVSEEPLVKNLWFGTQYGFMAAQFIADFDLLMSIFLTAKRVGVSFDKTHVEIKKEATQNIEKLFSLPFEWVETGITRNDFKNNTSLSYDVKEKLGKLPQSILDLELRSPFAPDIKSSSKEDENDEPIQNE